MLRYLGGRFVQAVATFIGVTLILFLLSHAIPGTAAQSVLGVKATPEKIAALNQELGLDRSLWRQYGTFVSGVFRGDLGAAYSYGGEPVTDVIFSVLPLTLELAAYAVVLSIIVTPALALLAAYLEGSWIDRIIRGYPLVAIGLPAFWVGAMLLILLTSVVRVFPSGGVQSGFGGTLYSLFLPAFTLAAGFSGILVRQLRNSLLELLESDYVMAARARGLSNWRVALRHVLPNALIPTVTLIGLIFGGLIGGTLVIEQVFALPGLGSLLISSFQQHDLGLVVGIAMVVSTMVLIVNLLMDVVYAALDPRISLR